jgi:hypothetical protein
MLTMLSNSLIQQHNANGLTCHITMKVASKDSSCSLVGWGARAGCAEVSTGSKEASKGKHGQKVCTEEYRWLRYSLEKDMCEYKQTATETPDVLALSATSEKNIRA